LELVEGTALARMVEEVREKPSLINVNPIISGVQRTLNLCPLCGDDMVLRTIGKGANAGKKFWFCASYPKCQGKRNHYV
jgi:restriction system protein